MAWLGADTTGVATILGGVWRVVGVVCALGAAVVLAVPEVVEVGNVVVVVPVLEVLEVLEASAAVGAVETVEVGGRAEEAEGEPEVAEFLSAVFLPGPAERDSVVVDVVEVEVEVVVSPLAVLGGVCGDNVAGGEVVGAVVGTAPDGGSGVVVLVVDALLVITGWPVVTGRVVAVDGTELLVDAVVVDVLGPVVGVVVVVDVEVVAEDVGTVVVVVDVVVVTPVPVVVVAAVVVVTVDDGGSNGVVKEVGSASAVNLGVSNAPRASPVAKSAPPDAATSRASHLLELWEDKRIRVPNVRKSGRQSQLAAFR